LIRRALLGLDYWLYDRAFLLPFCDYLKILLHTNDPVIVTVKNDAAGGQQSSFSTHRDIGDESSESFWARVPYSQCSVTCHGTATEPSLADRKAHLTLSKLFDHPDFAGLHEGRPFGDSLRKALSQPPIRPLRRTNAFDETHAETDRQMDWASIFAAIFRSVSSVVESSPHSSFVDGTTDGSLNLFAFVFRADASMPSAEQALVYHPDCILDDTQRKFMSGCETGGANQVDESNARFLRYFGRDAQMAFQTETVVFAEPTGILDEPCGREFPAVKTLVSCHRFYVPIHIEGAPWIVLLRFLKGPKRSRWYDAFHFYHDVVPRIGAMLRSEAKKAYLACIEEIFSQELTDADRSSFVRRYSSRCAVLLSRFPFPCVHLLDRAQTSAGCVVLPWGQVVSIELLGNPWFVPQVGYDALDERSVVESCNRALRTHTESAASFALEMRHQEHTIFNRLPTPDIQSASRRPATELSGKARQYVDDARRLAEVKDVALSIIFRTQDALNVPHKVGELLRWFNAHTHSAELQTDLVAPQPEQDCELGQDELASAFTVLWNLWHNASKQYGTRRASFSRVKAWWEDRDFLVSFQNQGRIGDDWVDYLLREEAECPQSEWKGLKIVKTRMQTLGWAFKEVTVSKQGDSGEITSVVIALRNRRDKSG
jgi:hypothetical protein